MNAYTIRKQKFEDAKGAIYHIAMKDPALKAKAQALINETDRLAEDFIDVADFFEHMHVPSYVDMINEYMSITSIGMFSGDEMHNVGVLIEAGYALQIANLFERFKYDFDHDRTEHIGVDCPHALMQGLSMITSTFIEFYTDAILDRIELELHGDIRNTADIDTQVILDNVAFMTYAVDFAQALNNVANRFKK